MKPGAKKTTRYIGNTGQLTKDAAERVEQSIKDRVRQEAYGVALPDREHSPSIHAFAQQHLARVLRSGKLKRFDALKQTLRLCMQFWGRRPAKPPALNLPAPWQAQADAARRREAAAPYHDLKLVDPILEPAWIERFEVWMADLGLSGGRKNHYRSAMSGIYRTALLPAYRKQSGVTMNPFLHIERDTQRRRSAVLTIEQIRAWHTAAAPHVRVAMALAVYAPELRIGAILGLKWKENLDRDLTRIVTGHKTDQWTGAPQAIPISDSLRATLAAVRAQQVGSPYVVSVPARDGTYKRLKRIDTALRGAIVRANTALPADQQLTYGADAGVTFHTIRHAMATLLAEWGEPEYLRQVLMGHRSIATTQGYTHLAARAKIDPLNRLANKIGPLSVVQERVQEARTEPGDFPKDSTGARTVRQRR
jgi:integrase